MPDLSPIYALISMIPLDCLQMRFMQQALLGVLLLAPMASVLGVEVINFRMEKILADISFDAPEMPGAQVVVNKAYVEEHLQDVRDDQDLSQYIL